MIGDVLNFISLILYAIIIPVHSQGYLSPQVLANGQYNESLDLVWNFTTESYGVVRIRFYNPQSEIMILVFPDSPPAPGTGFENKVEYKYPFGITIFNLNFTDSGIYTCQILLNNSQVYLNHTELNVYKFEGDLQHSIFLTTVLGEPIDGDIITDQVFDAVINVPENVPHAISVRMDANPISLGYTERFNVSSENVTLRINAPFNSVINITSLMKHPLFESGVMTMATVRVEDPYTSSVAPDDTSVSTYTPSSTEDPNTPTSSLAPDDTYVSTDNPSPIEDPSVTQPSSSPTVTATSAPKPGWSHWYILLIALGCLVILVVILVVIHNRAQRKDDDLDPVTELKPPSVHAAPADHVRDNTAGYRPSQHQHPRLEDNTAYYVQGTSGARL